MTKKTNLKPHPTFKNISADGIAECWDNVSIELQGFLWNTIVPLYPTLSQADKEDGITIDMQGNNVSDHWKLIPTKFKEELNALAIIDEQRYINQDDVDQAIMDKLDTAEDTETMTTEIETLAARAAEGKALATIWKSKDKKAQKEFAQDISATGFDTRLGTLLNTLVSESTLKRPNTISRQVLTTNNLYDIHKGRRSAALWFVQNKDTALDIIGNATKGFSSIDAVYNKYIEIQKQIAAEEKELNASDTDSDQDAAEPDADDSVIGGVDMAPTVTLDVMAKNTLDLLDANGFKLVDYISALTKEVAAKENIAVNKLAAAS